MLHDGMLGKLHGLARDVRDVRLIVRQASDVTKTSARAVQLSANHSVPCRQRLELSSGADVWFGKLSRIELRCRNAVFRGFCHGITPLQRHLVELDTTAVKQETGVR